MFKQKIFIYSFITLVIIGIFQYLGCKYDVYIIYPWYDIPMHLLGGLWVSLSILPIYNYFLKSNYISALYLVLFTLLFMTISWEIFELTSGITSLADHGYWPDTLGDIFNGFVGGIIGYFLYLKDQKLNN